MTTYETVIGLEVHAQLSTRTKMFCGCSTSFGAAMNSQTCPVCLGHPGVLPVVNETAFEYGVRVACALQCDIATRTRFDRKNYYYPDLPKNYQISQHYQPVGTNGSITLPSGLEVGIDNVHLEEDAGKLVHLEGTDTSIVDLNRAGVPLVEIVTDPDMRTIDQVDEYMQTLRDMLFYLDVCDCKMQEGSIRFEASISLRPEGSDTFGNRVEVKNLNSFAAVRDVLRHEVRRQTKVLESGGTIQQETRLWDAESETSQRMRTKEEAEDYRYFPEPDLAPIEVDDAWLAEIRESLPEMRQARVQRFQTDYGITDPDHLQTLTESIPFADYFEAAVSASAGDDATGVLNLLLNEVRAHLNVKKIGIEQIAVTPEQLAQASALANEGTISSRDLRQVLLPRMLETGDDPKALTEELGIAVSGDEETFTELVREAIAQNPGGVEDYLAGNKKVAGAFVGMTMGKAKKAGLRPNPKQIKDIVVQELEARR